MRRLLLLIGVLVAPRVVSAMPMWRLNESRARDDKTLVVSGGGSLGAYQAGFLYYYTLFLKHRPETNVQATDHFRIATGTSAGAINALLALLTGCMEARSPAVLDPEASLFYQAWINIGLSDLAHHVDSPDALLNTPFSAAMRGRVADVLNHATWSPRVCEAYLGVVTTRLRHRLVSVDDADTGDATQVRLKHQSERLLFRLSTPGGKAPAFTPYRRPSADHEPLLAQLYATVDTGRGSEDPVPLDTVLDVVQAAAAFPIVFPTSVLPLVTAPEAGDGNALQVQKARLSDGGWLDNVPLRLAQDLTYELERGEEPRYLFLLSDAQRWRTLAAEGPANYVPPTDSLVEEMIPAMLQFIDSSSDRALTAALENDAAPRDIPGRSFPVAGDQLWHFMALVERDLRVVDFYQGINDAYMYLGERNGCGFPLPDGVANAPLFQCIQDTQAMTHLHGGAVNDSLRVTLPPSCAKVAPNQAAVVQTAAHHYLRHRSTAFPGVLDELDAYANTLARYGFRYMDLAQGAVLDAADLRKNLRNHLHYLAKRLQHTQRFGAPRLAWSWIGQNAADVLAFRADDYLGLGGGDSLEFNLGVVLYRGYRWALRLVPGVRIHGPNSLFLTPSDKRLAFPVSMNVVLSAEGQVLSWFNVGGALGFGSRSTWFSGGPQTFRPGLAAEVTAVFLSRLFATAGGTAFLDHCSTSNSRCAVTAPYRDAPILIEPWPFELKLIAGWRFSF